MEPRFAKLIEYRRNNLVEQEHLGIVLHLSKTQVLNKVGQDNNYKFYQRSCMKPLQLALHIDLGLDKIFQFTKADMAVGAASHVGDLDHQKQVLSILKKICLDENALLCPAQVPLSKDEQDRLLILNESPKPIHNNCSGKHAMMLALCVYKGWSVENYLDDSHPLHAEIIKKVLDLSGVTVDYVKSKDGCGLPTVATTLEQLGFAFMNLFLDRQYSIIKDAFLMNPYLIGGQNRIDSEIMAVSSHLVAKVGAGGIIVVVNLQKEEAIVVKIADANMAARSLVVIDAIRQLDWIDENNINRTSLSKFYDKTIKTLQGEIIGNVNFCFDIR